MTGWHHAGWSIVSFLPFDPASVLLVLFLAFCLYSCLCFFLHITFFSILSLILFPSLFFSALSGCMCLFLSLPLSPLFPFPSQEASQVLGGAKYLCCD